MGVLASGTVLGGCRIDAVVGRGGMGVVYRARQLELDRDVALKVIAPELVEDPHTRERFLAEARAAGAVEHPNVIPVHGVGVAAGRAYLVMRYVAGEDLRTLVRRQGPLRPAHAARVALQLGNALDAIHRAGYVHRDVKPQNVMLDEAGHVYLSDFGLAKHALATDGPTRSDQWVGTLDYVAPEQIRGEPVDARADVYALGGVVHFMLTGRVPFEREDDEAKLWAHLAHEPPRPSAARPDLPAALDAVVQRALAKEPGRRHPSAGDLGRAVRAATGGRGDTTEERIVARGAAAPGGARGSPSLLARAPTLPSPPATAVSGPRHPGRRLALGGAAVAGAAVAVALLLEGDAERDAPARPPPPPPTPAGPRVGATIANVGFRPRAVAVSGRDVWVVSISRPRITRFDARTGRRRGPHAEVGRGASSIAAYEGHLWVSMPNRGEVLRLDRRTAAVTARIATPMRPVLVAAGRSGVWIVGRGATTAEPDALLHYDREGRLLHRRDVADGIGAVTLGRGFLWFSVIRNQPRIVRVSPDGSARHAAFVGAPATSLAYGAGYLWASVTEDDSVAQVHPRTRLAPTAPAGGRPAQIAVADGRVFVASSTDHTVVVLDPKTRKALGEPLPVRPNPYAVAAGAGHVWVTGMGENTLTRIDY